MFTLINSFTCSFLQNFNNFILERWQINKKRSGGCSRSSHLFSCLVMVESTTVQIEVARKMASQLQYFNNNIYISGPIFVKLSNGFNPSCLSPTFVKKSIFPMEHIKGPPSSQPSINSQLARQLASFFVFHIAFTLILKLLCLFFWLTKVHSLTKVTVCAKIHSQLNYLISC